jgi:signal transduction histidine kinase
VVEATVWFVVSEALSNAIKHACANELGVSAVLEGGELVVRVTDDGAGGACFTRGTGLRGLAARVEALGGELSIASPPGAGTTLTARLPL